MSWPQIVVLVLMVISTVHAIATWVRDDRLSSNQVSMRVMFHLAFAVAYAAVLSAGGFW